jgi:1,6-anhydro-N-acetylmuramate kinase
MRVAGIMSGTSLDGIDMAVIDITGSKFDVVTHCTTPYPGLKLDELRPIDALQLLSELQKELKR